MSCNVEGHIDDRLPWWVHWLPCRVHPTSGACWWLFHLATAVQPPGTYVSQRCFDVGWKMFDTTGGLGKKPFKRDTYVIMCSCVRWWPFGLLARMSYHPRPMVWNWSKSSLECPWMKPVLSQPNQEVLYVAPWAIQSRRLHFGLIFRAS